MNTGCILQSSMSAQISFSEELHNNVPEKDQAKFNLYAVSLMAMSPFNHILHSVPGG